MDRLASKPVKTHLGVEGDLVGSADESVPLAALVQRRPVVRACVRIVGTCSIFEEPYISYFVLLNVRL